MKNDQRFVKLIEFYSKGFRKLIVQFRIIRLPNLLSRNFQIQKTKKKSKAIVYQKRKNLLTLTFNFGCKFDCFVFISIKINFEPIFQNFEESSLFR